MTIRRALKWCRKNLGLLRKYAPLENGVAFPSTVCRILAGVDGELFALEFMEWIGEIVNTRGIHLSMDGKALRAAMEKVKNFRAPMVMNAMDAATGLVVAQLPIQNKDYEITAIPELLKLLDISGSTVTIDAVGTQTGIMKQVVAQGGHFLLKIKGNQPQSYGEVVKYFGEMSEDHEKMKENADYKPRHPEMMEGYEEVYCVEKNRDRYERRWYKVCSVPSLLTKTQEEWPFIKAVGQVEQVRILVERDAEGRNITPDLETFLKEGSRRQPSPTKGIVKAVTYR